MHRTTLPLSFVFFVVSATPACSGDGTDAGPADPIDGGISDSGTIPDTIVDLDTLDDEVVDGLGESSPSGDNAVLRLLPGGVPALAYGYVSPGETVQRVRFATRNGPSDWSVELVARPGEASGASGTLVGLGFDVVAGVPHVVYLGGDDDANVLTPFPTDLELAVRTGVGAWTTSVLVDTSGESNGDCSTLQDVCNFGNVVGSHAAVSANPTGGYSVVFRDTHGGFAIDDVALADVEVYRSGGGAELVDPERSAGPFADITHLADGTPVAAYYLPNPDPNIERTGIWVAYDAGGTYERVRVSPAATSAKVAITAAPGGALFLAFFDADNRDLVFAESNDGGATWAVETVDASGQTGLHPSIDVDASGQPVIAYTYCGLTSDRDCPGSLGPRSEVRLARREAAGWRRFRVHDGQGAGGVGLFTAVRVLPSGKIAVAFQDTFNSDLVYVEER